MHLFQFDRIYERCLCSDVLNQNLCTLRTSHNFPFFITQTHNLFHTLIVQQQHFNAYRHPCMQTQLVLYYCAQYFLTTCRSFFFSLFSIAFPFIHFSSHFSFDLFIVVIVFIILLFFPYAMGTKQDSNKISDEKKWRIVCVFYKKKKLIFECVFFLLFRNHNGNDVGNRVENKW